VITEIPPGNPYYLFATLVKSVDDNDYAVLTCMLDPTSHYINRMAEKQDGIEPEKNPEGFFQTDVYKVVDTEEGPAISLPDLLAVRRSMHGREAVKTHDEIVAQVESETLDYINDPYYQQIQVDRLKHELENLDISSLQE
jgi:hypothetical protein